MTSATDLIQSLGLAPHPEGGWYKEIFRSSTRVQTPRGSRSALTTIHYLLELGQLSRWHVVEADEIWHFYAGEPLQLLAYSPDSRILRQHVLGPVDSGHEPVAVIERGVWQAARPLGRYTLVGCSVGSGFEFQDFTFVAELARHETHFQGDLASFTQLL